MKKIAIVTLTAALCVLAPATESLGLDGPVVWWRFDDRTAVDSAGKVTDALQGNYRFTTDARLGPSAAAAGRTPVNRTQ